ncbi:hypothetical protein P9112_000252 [Eukaryota sp. TZLM1-RC]
MVLTSPGVDESDDVFLDQLRSFTSFSSYEKFNLVISELKVDVRKKDVRKRMSCYLKRFFQSKSRTSGLELPDSAFMIRFAKGSLSIGLQKSLISRIQDEVFPDFPTLLNTAEDEPLEFSRVASWNRSSKTVPENTDCVRQAGMKSRSSYRSRNLTDGTCFKCHQKGHLARDCPSEVKHEVNHLYHMLQYLTNPLSSSC